MADSESLARRIRQVVTGNHAITEIRSFEVIEFLLNGNTCVTWTAKHLWD